MNYANTIAQISTNLAKYFDNVYHSAELVFNDKNLKIPAIPSNDDWIDLSPSGERETVYVRRNGDDAMVFQQGIGSCAKAYKMRTPLRIVYFQDRTAFHFGILSKLMQASLIQNTTLNRVIRDKWKLAKEESSGDYPMGASTAYFAIDIDMMWDLLPDSCDNDFCITLDNPLKQCS